MKTIKEEVVRELVSNPERSRMFALIQEHLLTEGQGRFLTSNNLSLDDIFDGNFAPDDMDIIDAIFAEWNKLCGQKIFRLR